MSSGTYSCGCDEGLISDGSCTRSASSAKLSDTAFVSFSSTAAPSASPTASITPAQHAYVSTICSTRPAISCYYTASVFGFGSHGGSAIILCILLLRCHADLLGLLAPRSGGCVNRPCRLLVASAPEGPHKYLPMLIDHILVKHSQSLIHTQRVPPGCQACSYPPFWAADQLLSCAFA